MINYFTKLYSAIKYKNSFLKKIKFYSLESFIIRNIGNFIIPIYFKFTCKKKNYRLNPNNGETDRAKIIVSLTSFPLRMKRLHFVIESILRQSVKPDMIILWLCKEEVKSAEEIPKSLKKMQLRGLSIRFVEKRLRSHLKYYYAMKEYPNDIIITIDDDIMYPDNLIESLLACHHEHPKSICANYTIIISKDGNGNLLPFILFEENKIKNSESLNYLLMGVSGVLYPSGVLHKDLFDVNLITKLCPLADDLWLQTMALLQKTNVCQTSLLYRPLPVIIRNNTTLTSINIGTNRNDEQIQNIRKYYMREMNIDPFVS